MWRLGTLALCVGAVLWTAAAQDATPVTLPLKVPPSQPPASEIPAPQDVLGEPAPPEPAVADEGAPERPTPPAPQPKPEPPKTKTAIATQAEPASGEMKPVDDMPGGPRIPTPPGGAPSVRCFVRDVMAFYDRTHVRCYNKVRGKIVFFAVDTSQPVASTVLSKALSGMQTGKPVTITYAPGTDLNPSNCDRKNCRRLLDIQN